jgi:tetratricopeptide (TPR) repeat protein
LRKKGYGVDMDYFRVTPLALAKAGRLDEAFEAVRAVPSVDVRVIILAGGFRCTGTTFQDDDGIAQLQARAGDLEGAKATVRRALDLAGSAEYPSGARLNITRGRAVLGDLAGATETAETIDHPLDRDWARVGVVDALAAAGRWKDAFSEAGKIKNVGAKASALIRVGLAYGQVRDLAGARGAFGRAYEAVQELDTDRRHQALRHLARCQAEAGDVEGAFRTHDRAMETLESSSPRPPGPRRVDPFLLDQIAYQQAKSGDVAGARRTLETLTENTNWDYDTSKTLGAVARFQAATGPDGDAAALRWAEELDAPRQKAHALLGVARARGPKEGDGGRHAPAP